MGQEEETGLPNGHPLKLRDHLRKDFPLLFYEGGCHARPAMIDVEDLRRGRPLPRVIFDHDALRYWMGSITIGGVSLDHCIERVWIEVMYKCSIRAVGVNFPLVNASSIEIATTRPLLSSNAHDYVYDFYGDILCPRLYDFLSGGTGDERLDLELAMNLTALHEFRHSGQDHLNLRLIVKVIDELESRGMLPVGEDIDTLWEAIGKERRRQIEEAKFPIYSLPVIEVFLAELQDREFFAEQWSFFALDRIISGAVPGVLWLVWE